jgi:hypothetical protein
MAIKARFKGSEGEFIYGIPARNLLDEEYDQLDTDQKKLVRESSLYTLVDSESKADKKEGGS